VSAAPPDDVPSLLRALLGQDPGRPRVTWYGPGGERVELSAKVLDNWVAKTANLLTEELDAGPGTRIAVLLPRHWRTLVWLLAIWSAGAHALVPDPGTAPPAAADVLVTTDPAAVETGALVVAVALPALATTFGPTLPPGAIDAASAVRSYGDVFVPLVLPVPTDAALTVDSGPTVPYGRLLGSARGASTPVDGVRLLTSAGPGDALTDWLGPLARAGSLVLHHDLGTLTPPELEHLVEQEKVTAVHPEGLHPNG
jgi:uncharacterized protein (TIGR03089 family)